MTISRRPDGLWTRPRARVFSVVHLQYVESPMPIALKEWAVTVRALAEGEQLLTLRKGGIREENKHFELEHDRFFLYPTFDHQRNDVVRDSHSPELRRALEEGVWPDGDPPRQALTRDGGIPQPERVRVRAWAEVAGHYRHRPARRQRAVPVLHLDDGLRREAPGWKRRHPLHVVLLRTYRIPRPVTVRVRGDYARLPLVARDRSGPALRGHPGPLGRRVRARPGGDRGDLLRPRGRAGLSRRASDPAPDPRADARRVLCVGIGGGGDVVGALAVAGVARRRDGWEVGGITWERRPVDPLPGPRPLDELAARSRCTAAALAGPDTTGPGGFRFAETPHGRRPRRARSR